MHKAEKVIQHNVNFGINCMSIQDLHQLTWRQCRVLPQYPTNQKEISTHSSYYLHKTVTISGIVFSLTCTYICSLTEKCPSVISRYVMLVWLWSHPMEKIHIKHILFGFTVFSHDITWATSQQQLSTIHYLLLEQSCLICAEMELRSMWDL
jgi:hypothetical protein